MELLIFCIILINVKDLMVAINQQTRVPPFYVKETTQIKRVISNGHILVPLENSP